MTTPKLSAELSRLLKAGQVIPAHPLALDHNRKFDEQRQRALTRYYLDAGAGGMAVAVHTTQFEIRQPEVGLFQPVLALAAEEINNFTAKTGKPILKIGGIVGTTQQAVNEAKLLRDLGYDAGLLSVAALKSATNAELLTHCRAVGEIIPLIGFYLQPAVGGRRLDADFWREFARIESVVAIKAAPFNRYLTIDVLRGVAESGRADEVALYTGNDDNIIPDLITPCEFSTAAGPVTVQFTGGLLGHWAMWTHKVAKILKQVKAGDLSVTEMLTLGIKITDCNAAFFDVAHDFAGCIVGVHEVLRRQGLLLNNFTLNPAATLTEAQTLEIDRVYAAYPELNDDTFIAENIDRWLK